MIVVRFKEYCDVDVFTIWNILVNTETVVCYWWWDWLITENTYPIELDMCDHGHVWPLVTDEYVFLVPNKKVCTSDDKRYVHYHHKNVMRTEIDSKRKLFSLFVPSFLFFSTELNRSDDK
jgi:hypothetical protein